MAKFPIVCLCGSSKQKEEWLKYQRLLALKGYCVLNINVYLGLEKKNYNEEDELKQMLEAIHMQKVEMADIIAIIPKADGSIGDHTMRERCRAEELCKPIFMVEELLALPLWKLPALMEA